jgi:hypothetical protein
MSRLEFVALLAGDAALTAAWECYLEGRGMTWLRA